MTYVSWSDHTEVSELLGQTLVSVEVNEAQDEIRFKTTGNKSYLMYHSQDCCEGVSIESIVGDLSDLIGAPILKAEEATSEETPEGYKHDYEPESQTWTFYKLATIKGYVDIRWFGSSNGYYSESVSFALLMTRATVTPLQALKRLIEACKLVDFKDCRDLYNQFQTELAVAEMVVRDYVEPDDMAANYDHSTHDKRMELLRGMRDEQAAVVAAPVGYTLVPNSPNEEMLRPDGFSYRLGYEQYQAMLRAAPAIAAPVEVERWQPIETAPKGKNGISFMMLAYGPKDDQSVSIGIHIDGSFYAGSIFYCLGKKEKPVEIRENKVIPTHWMPIPDTPIDAAIATGDKK